MWEQRRAARAERRAALLAGKVPLPTTPTAPTAPTIDRSRLAAAAPTTPAPLPPVITPPEAGDAIAAWVHGGGAGATPILVIVGPGGSGKAAAVLAAAHSRYDVQESDADTLADVAATYASMSKLSMVLRPRPVLLLYRGVDGYGSATATVVSSLLQTARACASMARATRIVLTMHDYSTAALRALRDASDVVTSVTVYAPSERVARQVLTGVAARNGIDPHTVDMALLGYAGDMRAAVSNLLNPSHCRDHVDKFATVKEILNSRGAASAEEVVVRSTSTLDWATDMERWLFDNYVQDGMAADALAEAADAWSAHLAGATWVAIQGVPDDELSAEQFLLGVWQLQLARGSLPALTRLEHRKSAARVPMATLEDLVRDPHKKADNV
jgi:hypothetical protein